MSSDLDTRGKRPQFFDQAETDALMTALLETMSQSWATRERVLALERVLEQSGVIEPGAVERWVFSEAEQAELEVAQQAFLQESFRALGARFQSLSGREADIDDFQRDGDT